MKTKHDQILEIYTKSLKYFNYSKRTIEIYSHYCEKFLIVLFLLLWGITITAQQPDRHDTFLYGVRFYSEENYVADQGDSEWQTGPYGPSIIFFYQYESPEHETTSYWEFISVNTEFILEEGYVILDIMGEDSVCYKLTTVRAKGLFYENDGILTIETSRIYTNVLEYWDFKSGEIIYFDDIEREDEWDSEVAGDTEKFINALKTDRTFRKEL